MCHEFEVANGSALGRSPNTELVDNNEADFFIETPCRVVLDENLELDRLSALLRRHREHLLGTPVAESMTAMPWCDAEAADPGSRATKGEQRDADKFAVAFDSQRVREVDLITVHVSRKRLARVDRLIPINVAERDDVEVLRRNLYRDHAHPSSTALNLQELLENEPFEAK